MKNTTQQPLNREMIGKSGTNGLNLNWNFDVHNFDPACLLFIRRSIMFV